MIQRFFALPHERPAVGWESCDDASARFVAGVASVLRNVADPKGDVVVCSGGRVLTAALMRWRLIDAQRAYDVWSSISLPDLAIAELSSDGLPTGLITNFGEAAGW